MIIVGTRVLMEATTDITEGNYNIAVDSASPMSAEEYVQAIAEGWRLHHTALSKVLASGPALYDTTRESLPDKRGHIINTYA